MFRSRSLGFLVVATLAIGLLAVVVLPAFGQPPLNDERSSPTLISALPYAETLDTTEATQGFDDPYVGCPTFSGMLQATVWYAYAAGSAETVVASTSGSDYSNVVVILDQYGWPIACGSDASPVTFSVNPGESYEILIGARGGGYPGYPGPGGGGELVFSLDAVVGPANDDFAEATSFSTVPFSDLANLAAATREASEPQPNCAYDGLHNTVWYAFTPAVSGAYSVVLQDNSFEAFLAAYTGASLNGLTELGCRNYFYGDLLTIPMVAGTTYYFQVGNSYSWQQPGTVRFSIDVPPPPQADFGYWPSDPSRFDQVQFYSNAYDPAGLGIDAYLWDFGDGTTSTESYVQHSYPADGDYEVTLTVFTPDGRSATVSKTVHVETHDVTITRFKTPNSVRAGQTRNITVGLTNANYDELVTVSLYRSGPYGYEYVGSLTTQAPVRSGNRTTDFDFSYTFTAEDALLGSVTFRAEAWLNGARDALPANNEAISLPTNVNP